MSNERSRKSHAMGWAAAIIAVPMLFVLSYQPILCWVQKQPEARDSTIERVQSFYKLRFWLDETPLKVPMRDYEEWVLRILNPG